MSYKSETYTSKQVKRDGALVDSARAMLVGLSLRGTGAVLTGVAGYFAAAENTAGFVASGVVAASVWASGLRLGAERVAALERYRNYYGHDDRGLDDGGVPGLNVGDFRRLGRVVGTASMGAAGAMVDLAARAAESGSAAEGKVFAGFTAALALGIGGNVVAEAAANTDFDDHGPANADTEPRLHQLLGLAERPAAEVTPSPQ